MDIASSQPQPSASQVLDGLPDGVVAAGPDGRVTALNTEAGRLLGVDPDQCLGQPLDQVLTLLDTHGTSWVETNQPWSGLRIRTGVPEQSWTRPDGEEVLTRARIHRDSGTGAVGQVVVSLRDGRGRARLDRDRSDLVATVAHELRSPLTGVKGFVQALLNRWDQLNDEQRKLMLTTVHADAERLTRLITELLDVARLDTGRLSMFPRPVDVALLAGRVVDSISAGTATPVTLSVHGTVPEIHADPDKFTQILTNLVENGVHHGQGPVEVRLAPGPDEAHVLVVVRDHGLGIPVEVRRRAFTKFWTQGQSGGTGLGLYLVNGLTRAQGARLSIGDAPEGGAEVTLAWPVAQW